MQVATTVRGLAQACHLAPTATVTVAVTALAVAAGVPGPAALLLSLAVLTGQLSVGWSNDALDAERDTVVGRIDKPVVAGLVSRRLLAGAAVVALVASAALSFAAAGIAGGLCHLLFLASAWVYNLGVKATRLSLVPYAVGFGALPGFVTFALDPPRAPQPWALLAAGLLGVAAGLANAAPDIDGDRATGVRGAVGRLGARSARAWCVVVLVVVSAVLAVGADLDATTAVTSVLATAVLGGGALAVRGGRYLFPAVLLIALIDVVLLITHTAELS